MLESIVWILLAGFLAGQVARQIKMPALLGMVLVGIVLGPQLLGVIDAQMLSSADGFRTIAVMVILMKAGLGLDREKLLQQGPVAVKLGFLPGVCEAIAIALAAMWLFQFDILTGLLLGCIIGAESPAVIVPGMLRLKRLGWGSKKGIPDAILMGSALSDVLLLLVFSLLLAFLMPASAGADNHGLALGGLSPLLRLPFQAAVQIAFGIICGRLSASVLATVLRRQTWTQNTTQDTLVAAAWALGLVVLATALPLFSGYLAVMSLGFFLIERDASIARRLRTGFNSLWTVAEIFLFVLLGASIQVDVLRVAWLPGLLLLVIGTLVGRSIGWYLATVGSDWTPAEKLFLLPGNSAKATVQAALGAIPLAMGIDGGEIMLAIAALSILVSAPLGAWAIPTFAPKLLTKGSVDPTKVLIEHHPVLLAAVDASDYSTVVLTKSAELARSRDGEIIVFYVRESDDPSRTLQLRLKAQTLLVDIPHQFVVDIGSPPQRVAQAADAYQVDEIVMGKRGHQAQSPIVGSTTRAVVSMTQYPVMIVDAG